MGMGKTMVLFLNKQSLIAILKGLQCRGSENRSLGMTISFLALGYFDSIVAVQSAWMLGSLHVEIPWYECDTLFLALRSSPPRIV